MANAGYEAEGRRETSWSDLPTELMELVLQNCSFSDQARLRAACRRWQSIPRVKPRRKQHPWLMAYDDEKWSTLKLSDLTYQKTYTVNISTTMREYYQEMKPDYIQVFYCKYGWLLLSHTMCQNPNTAFLLYSPFTNRMIQLPNLHTASAASYWKTAALSADPTSADCVFFVLCSPRHTNTTVVSTCRLGDTTWTTLVFPRRFSSANNVVYSEGNFWCFSLGGTVGTFSVAEGTWNVLQLPGLNSKIITCQETYFAESNGDILLLVITFIDYKHNIRDVFKLDRSQMSWTLVEDVGDQTLFLGSDITFCVNSSCIYRNKRDDPLLLLQWEYISFRALCRFIYHRRTFT